MLALSVGMAAGTARSAGITGRPEPLLYGPSKGPCDPKLDQPTYVAGTDVDGRAVAPADFPRAKMPAPDSLLVPVPAKGSAGRVYANLDGKSLDSLLNPKPACAR